MTTLSEWCVAKVTCDVSTAAAAVQADPRAVQVRPRPSFRHAAPVADGPAAQEKGHSGPSSMFETELMAAWSNE